MTLFTKQNILAFLGVALLLATYFLFLAHPVNLVTADLGRHIKNGQHFVENFEVIKTNFYSYTHPDFPTTNHHWLIGVIFYLLYETSGIAGPQIFFIVLSLATLYVFYKIARRFVSSGWAGLFALLAIPLLAERTEVRPEVVSYLFSGIFFWLLLKYRLGELRLKHLLWLLPLQIVWVNSHIYFFLGLAITGAFFLEGLVRDKFDKKTLGYLKMILLLVGVSLINPFGIRGVIAPFTIWENFGYDLVENKSILFLETLFTKPNFTLFKIIFAVLFLTSLYTFIKQKTKIDLVAVFISVGVSVMAWLMLRNFALFGFFFIPVMAIFSRQIWSGKFESINKFAVGVMTVVFLLTASGEMARAYPYSTDHSFGSLSANGTAAEFFLENNVEGPIFNNYDIGGYLIFHLFPRHRVFVDNRPEAYPESFFQQRYIPMQEDGSVWKEELEKVDFNAIFFSHRDATPWGQEFLVQRIQDPDWAVVFADRFVIIFLRRNEQNQDLIEEFEIPLENLNS